MPRPRLVPERRQSRMQQRPPKFGMIVGVLLIQRVEHPGLNGAWPVIRRRHSLEDRAQRRPI
jgi:hypothetical protein